MDERARALVVTRWIARTRAELASADTMLSLAAGVHAAGHPTLATDLRRAAEDERRHGLQCADVVRRLGAAAPIDSGDLSTPPTTLAGIGATAERVVFLLCAGEAIAAALLEHQAAHASAPEVAPLLTGIAADETRHGTLGLAVLDALLPQLDPVARHALGSLAPRQAMRAVVGTAAQTPASVPPDAVAWGCAIGPRHTPSRWPWSWSRWRPPWQREACSRPDAR